MKAKIIIISISVLFWECNNKQDKIRIQKEGYTLEGNIENDSTLQGLINYYDSNNRLVYKATFLNNVKQGLATNYYSNGVKKDESFFNCGKQNGEHIEYDSTGKITYKDYYYYGKQIGPMSFFKEDGSLKESYFLDFEGRTLIYRSYDSIQFVREEPNNYFHMNVSDAMQDNMKKIQLFIYVLQLPNFSFKYKICSKDTSNNILPIIDIPTNQIFYQTYLPSLKNKSNYCILLNTFDSLTKKKLSIVKEIILSD